MPALPLLLVAAAGLAAGWAGSTLIGRRKRHETVLDEDVPTTGLGRDRPIRTLAWCPVCHAHMAPGHICRPHLAGEGESRREGGAGPLP